MVTSFKQDLAIFAFEGPALVSDDDAEHETTGLCGALELNKSTRLALVVQGLG